MSGLLLLRTRLPAKSLLSRCLQVRPYGILGKPGKAAAGPTPSSLPTTPARTRFAPSPTGYLHLGSIRTALYNYLLAKATGGQFILRLEDTDQARFVEDAEERLYDDLKWAGMTWDEGPDKGGPFGPYKQSERLGLYKTHAELLLDKGHAFRCFCPNKPAVKPTTDSETAWASGYQGTCQFIPQSESDERAANGEPHVIRFNANETKEVEYVDVVYGQRRVKVVDSFPIIMKSDGFPTYHFANVVDDRHMKITHVIRGAEWLISTPLHVQLYQAFSWDPPSFGHVGLLVDQQRQKLSKRDKDNIGVSVFRSNHILPQALMNFSVLLGWNPQPQENRRLSRDGVLSMQEMQENFSLKFTRGDIVVDLTKLKFFQSKWTRNLISGTANDPTALAKFFVKPIASIVKRVDKILYVDDRFQNARGLKQKHRPQVPAAEALFLQDLGIDIDHHKSLTYGDEKRSVEDHVLAVLRAAKYRVQSPEQFVRDCKYAFFPPTAEGLKNSVGAVRGDMYDDRQIDYWRIGQTSVERKITFARAMNVFYTQLMDLRNRTLHEDRKATEAKEKKMAMAQEKKIPPQKRKRLRGSRTVVSLENEPLETWWNEERILRKLTTIADAITVRHVGVSRDLTAPWRYLKWAFLCAEEESAHISIVKLLLAWGPTRTFKMAKRACAAASVEERLLAKDMKRELKARRRIRREFRLVARDLDARDEAPSEATDPFTALLPHDEQSGDDARLRSAHREGAFVSKGPCAPEKQEAESPADRAHLSQMLRPHEWKDGSRRLPVAVVEKAASFNADLPFGVIPEALAQKTEEEAAAAPSWFHPDREKGDGPSAEPERGPLAPPGTPRRNRILRTLLEDTARLRSRKPNFLPDGPPQNLPSTTQQDAADSETTGPAGPQSRPLALRPLGRPAPLERPAPLGRPAPLVSSDRLPDRLGTTPVSKEDRASEEWERMVAGVEEAYGKPLHNGNLGFERRARTRGAKGNGGRGKRRKRAEGIYKKEARTKAAT